MNKVLFFAHLREAVGKDYIEIDAAGKTVAQLKEELQKQYDLPRFESVMTAINEEFCQETDVIREGDEIAFIPPVSGG